MNIFKIFIIASFLTITAFSQENKSIIDKTKEIVVNKLSDIQNIEKEKELEKQKQEELDRLKKEEEERRVELESKINDLKKRIKGLDETLKDDILLKDIAIMMPIENSQKS